MELKLQTYRLQRKLQVYLTITYRVIAHCSVAYKVIAYIITVYKLLPIDFRFEKSWELDKLLCNNLSFLLSYLCSLIFIAICLI
jgi:hypothetical protein